MPRSLSDLRRNFPKLGFALYAIEPGKAVTFEIYDGADIYTFKGATAEDAIAAAFPDEPEPESTTAPDKTGESILD